MTGRYAPPKSKVGDVLPDARQPLRLRTLWLYTAFTGLLLSVAFGISERLLEEFSPLTLAAGLALTALLSAWPVQKLAALRSASLPLWWNILFYGVMALMIGGTFMEEGVPLLVGYLSMLAFSAVVVIACWVVEARSAVRVYSTANAFVIVSNP